MIPKENFTDVTLVIDYAYWFTYHIYLAYLAYLVIIAKEVKIVKEVMACGDVSLLRPKY